MKKVNSINNFNSRIVDKSGWRLLCFPTAF